MHDCLHKQMLIAYKYACMYIRIYVRECVVYWHIDLLGVESEDLGNGMGGSFAHIRRAVSHALLHRHCLQLFVVYSGIIYLCVTVRACVCVCVCVCMCAYMCTYVYV